MKFRIDCVCGAFIEVGEGAAGATFPCACGREIAVPSLADLRTRAGLPANHISPEFVIEHLLLTGDLVKGKSCVLCRADTDIVIHVETECERVTKQHARGFSWTIFFITLILCPPILVWYVWASLVFREPPQDQEFGRDKIYPLPLRICQACQQRLIDAAAIKQCLRRIPEYEMLLEKFPDAKVSVSK